MKSFAFASVLALASATTVFAEAEKYTLDPSHSQIVFAYNHLGYSTTFGMFSGFEGTIMFDQDDPSASSVEVSMPVKSMFTGWEGRFDHFMNDDFFGATDDEMVSFKSSSINVTGDNTAEITGDLTLNGVTKEITLNAQLNKAAQHPMKGKDWAGFDATTTLVRSDYELGKFAPHVGDEVQVQISIEAEKAE